MSINQKNINFWKKIICNIIDSKAIIHKCTKFQTDISKNKNSLTFLWKTITITKQNFHTYKELCFERLIKNDDELKNDDEMKNDLRVIIVLIWFVL